MQTFCAVLDRCTTWGIPKWITLLYDGVDVYVRYGSVALKITPPGELFEEREADFSGRFWQPVTPEDAGALLRGKHRREQLADIVREVVNLLRDTCDS